MFYRGKPKFKKIGGKYDFQKEGGKFKFREIYTPLHTNISLTKLYIELLHCNIFRYLRAKVPNSPKGSLSSTGDRSTNRGNKDP